MQRELCFGTRTFSYDLTRKRVRRINARVRKDGTLAVSAPPFVNAEKIDAFLLANANKLLVAIDRARAAKENAPRLSNGATIPILGVPHVLVITYGARRSVELENGSIRITIREGDGEREAQVALSSFLMTKAKPLLTQMFYDTYQQFFSDRFERPALRFRRMRSSWGNCRRESGVITLNLRLLYAPKEAISYVMMHELVHMLHPNHSPRFFATLSGYMPNHALLRSRLSKVSIAFDSFF